MKTDDMIHDRGRGPEIKGTRITVYSILDYLLECWHPARIAAWLNISSAQVEAAVEYIRENTIEVLKDYVKILERCERGNPPELQAKLDANHVKFQELVKQIREAKARGETDVPRMIQEFKEARAKEHSNARNNGGQ